MIRLILVVFIIMDAVLLWLWLVRVHGELSRFREQINCSWIQLREAIISRREIMPYLIASISLRGKEVVQAMGNACDLASQVSGIAEQSRAETRINAALRNMLILVADHSELKSDESFIRVCRELRALDERIHVLMEVYNKQVKTYNDKLEGHSARFLGVFVPTQKAEPFLVTDGGACDVLARIIGVTST